MTTFNELEQFLRDATRSERNVPFGGLISRAGDKLPAVRHYSRDLREWADLRNAVVHEHPRGKVIADITPEALAEFEEMAAAITSPPGIYPRFRRDVRVFKVSDPLTEAVEDLWREDYSQVIVRVEGRMTLLSYAGITRWMGHVIDGTVIDLEGATVGDALVYEKPGGIDFLARAATTFEARERFQQLDRRKEQRLRVIVITEHGDPAEAPLGLVTPSDMLSAGSAS
ncbi:MAG: hypothetical protein IT335_01055 [Thermomicrobiales bacterium]|nr:hypothetical protein [Thermomicrobiales bacterium]